jgi:hypothetical protein
MLKARFRRTDVSPDTLEAGGFADIWAGINVIDVHDASLTLFLSAGTGSMLLVLRSPLPSDLSDDAVRRIVFLLENA